jgi:hypothetical protein
VCVPYPQHLTEPVARMAQLCVEPIDTCSTGTACVGDAVAVTDGTGGVAETDEVT